MTKHQLTSVSFFRLFGVRCFGCEKGVTSSDMIRRVNEHIFHLRCLTCSHCNRQIETGEELFKTDENKFLCKSDYESRRKKSMAGKFFASSIQLPLCRQIKAVCYTEREEASYASSFCYDRECCGPWMTTKPTSYHSQVELIRSRSTRYNSCSIWSHS